MEPGDAIAAGMVGPANECVLSALTVFGKLNAVRN